MHKDRERERALNALPSLSEKALLFTDFCFVTSPKSGSKVDIGQSVNPVCADVPGGNELCVQCLLGEPLLEKQTGSALDTMCQIEINMVCVRLCLDIASIISMGG